MSQIKTKFIENSAVTGAKIASAAVDENKLAASVAGAGLTGGAGSALAVGAGDAITVAADSVAVDATALAGQGLENDGSNNLRISAAAAGAGLTGGAGSALAVGAGDGITVNADDVAVNTTAIAGTGLENDGSNNLRIAASAAGAGLTGGAGSALAVGAGTGITVNADDVAVDTTVIATRAYVDSAINGLDWKASVRVATTAPGVLATDFENGDTIDGVVLATGDRILIKDQILGATNGIYTVNASGVPTRATDADTSAEVTAGLAVFIAEGTVNADTGWVLTTNDPITLDTTALVFAQFNGAGSITAGAGLTKTGNTLDVGAGDGITVNADDVAVNTTAIAGQGLENDGSNNLRIAAAAAGAGLTGGAGSALAVGAGDGITVNADDVAVNVTAIAGAALENDGSNNLRVRVDASTVKINGSNNLESLKKYDELMTLVAGDITNQYVDLDFAAYSAESISLTVIGGIMQERGTDFTVSLTGGVGGVTRLTFAGDLATGGNAALISGDKLVASYAYLT